MLHTDLPSMSEFKRLAAERADMSVSIFLPTTPLTQDVEASRITFGNLVKTAHEQLAAAGADKRRLAALGEQLDDLAEDDEFWRLQANSLAVLATPDRVVTFRLANHVTELVQVSDRFHLKPLLRALTFSQAAYVLALSENDVRLIEVFPDLPAQEIRVPNLPKDAASAVGLSTLNDRAPKRRITGSEGQKVRLTQYCRKVDAALRPVLSGTTLPLIIAATEPLASIYRSVSSHHELLPDTLTHSNDRSTPGEIADAARPVLDAAHARQLAAFVERFEQHTDSGRAITDVADAARAATFGSIDTLVVNMDGALPGHIDEETGAVTFETSESAGSYGVVDEIVSRALATGATVLAVRKPDIPGGGELAATLRYAG
jgi:hypothetical protein